MTVFGNVPPIVCVCVCVCVCLRVCVSDKYMCVCVYARACVRLSTSSGKC